MLMPQAAGTLGAHACAGDMLLWWWRQAKVVQVVQVVGRRGLDGTAGSGTRVVA